VISEVPDGSPDECGRICDAYAEVDTRVHVVHKKNEGTGGARNSGIKACQGEYIMFVDSDDHLSLEAVQCLYDRMLSDGSDMAIGKHTDVYENGRINSDYCTWMQDTVVSGIELLSMMAKQANIPVSPWGKLYKREVLTGIRYPSLLCGEDLWVYPEIVEKCGLVSLVNENVYFYFQRMDSVVHRMSEKARRDELDATLHMAHFLLQREIMNSARRWYSRAISKSVYMEDTATALHLFKQYFDSQERRQLLRGASIKEYGKWVLLHVPFVKNLLYKAKNSNARGK